MPTITPGIRHNSRREAEQVRSKYRAKEHVWRNWYGLKRWKVLRLEVLERDLWICQRTGEVLSGLTNASNSPVVHHIMPHDGDPDLFWDISNLQAVSKEWHDSEGQKDDLRYRGAIKRRPAKAGGE